MAEISTISTICLLLVLIVWISRVYEQDDFSSPSAARRYLDYLNYSSSLGLDSDFRVNIYYLNYVLFVAFLVWIVWISRVYEQDDLCVPRAYFFVSSQIFGKVTIFFLNLQEKYKLFFKKIIL